MEGFYRIAAATPRLHLGDPATNAKELVRLAKDAVKDGVSAIVFPELCLTGYTCGDMFFRDELLTAANAATETYAMKTANLPIVSIVGLPVAEGPAIYNAAADRGHRPQARPAELRRILRAAAVHAGARRRTSLHL